MIFLLSKNSTINASTDDVFYCAKIDWSKPLWVRGWTTERQRLIATGSTCSLSNISLVSHCNLLRKFGGHSSSIFKKQDFFAGTIEGCFHVSRRDSTITIPITERYY